jgi:hypothetical protein
MINIDNKKEYVNIQVDGIEYKLLSLKSVPIVEFRDIDIDSGTSLLDFFIDKILPPELAKTLTVGATEQLLNEWNKQSDINLK